MKYFGVQSSYENNLRTAVCDAKKIGENIQKSLEICNLLKEKFYAPAGAPRNKKEWINNIQTLSKTIPNAFEAVHHFERSYSQYQEDIIINEIFKSIGTKNKVMVDIGAGNGIWISNSLFFRERGWECLLIDGDPHIIGQEMGVQKHWITLDNINQILKSNKILFEFDLLSLDIDGNDYHFLKQILEEFRPRVIISEINIFFGNTDDYMPYNLSYNHHAERKNNYGQSIAAAARLGKENGYVAVALIQNTNIILVREDAI